MSGETIKTVLEDVCDNLFNPDPYYQQGGDMVRVGGLELHLRSGRGDGQAHPRTCAWTASRSRPRASTRSPAGRRWPKRRAGAGHKPVWEVVEAWLRSKRTIAPRRLNMPRLIGVDGNPGLA